MSDYQPSRRIVGLASRHPRKVALLRIAIGIYLLVLTAVLIATGVGDPWAWVTGGFAAVHFALAYRRLRTATQRADLHPGLS